MREGLKHILILLIIWAIILIVECLIIFGLSLSDQSVTFEFRDVTRIWEQTLPFAILFIVHDLVIAPLLTEKKKLWIYLAAASTSVILFGFYIFNNDTRLEKNFAHEHFNPNPLHEHCPVSPTPPPFRDFAPSHETIAGKPLKPEELKLVVALLLICVDLGSRYYRRYKTEEHNLEELEKDNLKYRLEYLRYQINPHFFMNTLNNIHALVDIDSEKAKDSIVELSKMMRHVLYESNGHTVPLSKEIDFLNHYISLMKLRFTDKVKIRCSFTDNYRDSEVPPLLMATVIENAFKFGVSYSSESHIDIEITTEEGKVIFRCENSLKNSDEAYSCGVGLKNIRNRLELLYGNDYTMGIDSSKGKYIVMLVLPSKSNIKISNT